MNKLHYRIRQIMILLIDQLNKPLTGCNLSSMTLNVNAEKLHTFFSNIYSSSVCVLIYTHLLFRLYFDFMHLPLRKIKTKPSSLKTIFNQNGSLHHEKI